MTCSDIRRACTALGPWKLEPLCSASSNRRCLTVSPYCKSFSASTTLFAKAVRFILMDVLGLREHRVTVCYHCSNAVRGDLTNESSASARISDITVVRCVTTTGVTKSMNVFPPLELDYSANREPMQIRETVDTCPKKTATRAPEGNAHSRMHETDSDYYVSTWRAGGQMLFVSRLAKQRLTGIGDWALREDEPRQSCQRRIKPPSATVFLSLLLSSKVTSAQVSQVPNKHPQVHGGTWKVLVHQIRISKDN